MGLRTAVKFTAVALVLLFACVSVGYLGFELAFALTNGAGPYTVTLSCGSHTASATVTVTYQHAPLVSKSLACTPGGVDPKDVDITHSWNDLEIEYVVDGGPPTMLKVGPDPDDLKHPAVGKPYVLQSPSPGGTVTPTPNDPPTDAMITVTSVGAAGGLAELPDAAGSSGPPYALLAGALAAVLALGAGAWYARRRWVK